MEELDDEELLFTRIKNEVASSKEIFDYINKLNRRIKDLEAINKSHQELNGALREGYKI